MCVEAGCDLSLENEQGKTAVMVAAGAGKEEVTVVLLAKMEELSEKIGEQDPEAEGAGEEGGDNAEPATTAGDLPLD